MAFALRSQNLASLHFFFCPVCNCNKKRQLQTGELSVWIQTVTNICPKFVPWKCSSIEQNLKTKECSYTYGCFQIYKFNNFFFKKSVAILNINIKSDTSICFLLFVISKYTQAIADIYCVPGSNGIEERDIQTLHILLFILFTRLV